MAFTPPGHPIPFILRSDPAGIFLKLPTFIESISAAFSPSWNTYSENGRAEPKVLLSQFSKTVSIQLKVVTEDNRRNPKSIFRDLQALGRLTTPNYYGQLSFQGTFVHVTIGKIYVDQPMILTNAQITWDNTQVSWDIGPPSGEGSGTQLPQWADVSLDFTWIGKQMPSQPNNYFR